ncbi:MAG: ComEC/Rec2 family competence protein [Eubacterium sp.]|nr:ComEC/Rec2 family competence protein [Eubacterium sp.]
MVEAGRYITVTGSLVEIEGATNPGQMDMQEYYMSRGIKYQIKADHFEVSEKVANPVLLYLGRFRRKAAGYIDRYFEPEEAGIIKNMLLGDRSDMSPKTRILYQRNGIAHVLAISGLHIMLLASFLEWVLSKMYVKKNVASMITIFFMLLYAVMTGMSHATTRALLMLVIGRSAFVVKRTPDIPTSMSEALLIMMMINPDCIFSTGMLMSFAALGGVWAGYLVYERVFGNERFKAVPEMMRPLAKGLLKGLIATFSIGLMLTPMMIMSNFEIPLLSMLVNLIVTSLLSFVIACGFIVIVMGFMFDALAMIGVGGYISGAGSAGALFGGVDVMRMVMSLPVSIATLILRFYSILCEKIPPSSIVITGHLEVWQVVIAYLVIAVVLVIYLDEKRRRKVFEKLGMKTVGVGVRMKPEMKLRVMKEKKPEKVSKMVQGKMPEKVLKMMQGKMLEKVSKMVQGKMLEKVSRKRERKKEETISDVRYRKLWNKVIRVARYIALCTLLILSLAEVTKIYNLTFRGVVFLDVGQGDGSIIRSSAGRNYIIDCGSSDREEIGRYTLVPALKYYGMGRVDAVMISHTDTDHVGGIIELLEERELYGIEVNAVVVAAGTEEDENYARIRKAFEASGRISEAGKASGRISEAGAGDEIDGVFEVIYPKRRVDDEQISVGPEDGMVEESGNQEDNLFVSTGNDYSLVLDYRDGDVEVLYTGDIGVEAESNILDKISKLKRLKLRILKCAHHGSKYSSSEGFLRAYSPDVTVISSGRNNYGHPSPVTIRRLEKTGTHIIRTDTSGAVVID